MGGISMRKILLWVIVVSLIIFVTACKMKEGSEITLPDNIPDFVQEKDFEAIDWNRKAVEFGEYGVIGNKNKSGVIGSELPSLTTQKWMWHIWGNDNTELTIIGFHRESRSVEYVLTDGWSLIAQGENNGADAHAPSNVVFSKPGEWAVLLYTDGELFDTLVFEINE